MEDYNIFKNLAISSALLILCAVIRVVYTIWWRPKSLEKQLRQQGIKGTSYKLLHGDMKEIKKSTIQALSKPMTLNHRIAPRVLPFFHEMVQKYGKVCLSWIETRPRLIIGDPELIRLILADKNDEFVSPPLNPLVKILQQGVATLQGERWAKRRRLITPAFHFEKLKRMVPAFSTSCVGMIDRWKKMIGPEGSSEIDVAQEFQNLAGDVIARTAFGSSYEEGKRIFELQKEQGVLVIEAYTNIYIPGFRFLPTKKNKRRYEIDKEIKSMLRKMIAGKEQAMRNGEFGDNDLLGLLLQCKEESDSGMTIDDVIEECKLFYFAGQETTAGLLTWTMIVLSMHPDWQQKARDEVLQICAKRPLDSEAINQLKIVQMILYEVLRLYPPLTCLYRHTRQRTNIGGFSIPAGVDLTLPILFLHDDPNYWGKDVEKFKPERFSEGVRKASKDDQNAFYPFGWGPRICLGQNFTMIEAKLALAMILRDFSFQLSPSYTHAPCSLISLQPQYGAPIIVHRI
ncbi:cytochrome P450 CYP72A616-like [Corylus avellana]|uniref:cytochrome P450 CYP72A616-like n=1 Tax=Corylus avellana TaxID=13451 RepID=UPI001E215EE2|nr:cytochrome P450 CYP72A616-like [Corylus avellana]